MFKQSTSLKTNIIANFAGRGWMALMSILFVPVYLRYLSIEVYGIIGFFTSLQTVLSLLDGGISPTLSREVARLSAFPDKAQEIRDLSRTLEILCWITALFVGGIALLISPLIANYWLHSGSLSSQTVTQSLMLMSVSFTFQWAITFYLGGLIGLQQQKLYNLVNCIGITFRSVGAFLILAFVSATIQAFLMWQVLTSFLTMALMAIVYWRCLPPAASKPAFRLNLLRGVWRYAAGMTGISLVSLILTQSDKIVLSRLLTLEYFGYYTLAATLASTAIGMIVGSIGNAYFPQFSQLVARDDIAGLRELYHRSSQVMSVFLLPVMIMLSVFSFEILQLWTRNEQIVANTYILLALVAIGSGLNGLMVLPYFIQLAFGMTKMSFYINIGAIVLLIPFMIFATSRYGAVGGALTWAILNFLYIVIGLQIMHRWLLQGELKRWYLRDVGIPLATSLLIALGFHIIVPKITSPVYIFITLASVFTLLLFACVFVTPQIRRVLFYQFNRLIKT
jgi:O-antigen/teichoic acid export membrane protein